MVTISSRFKGVCGVCGRAFPRGERIRPTPLDLKQYNYGWAHQNCVGLRPGEADEHAHHVRRNFFIPQQVQIANWENVEDVTNLVYENPQPYNRPHHLPQALIPRNRPERLQATMEEATRENTSDNRIKDFLKITILLMTLFTTCLDLWKNSLN